MSSSSSDSDDLEPIRRIKINIQPKDGNAKRDGADVDAIKASVEAWRPLCPRPHHTLTRRQPSLSSVSSLSFGTGSNHGGSSVTTATSSTSANNHNFNFTQGVSGVGAESGPTATAFTTATTRGNISNQNFLRSSPSCSSLVNEFNNRTSFSNFMSNTSRTSSPLTFINNYGDVVPIALAIQESIELTVKGQQGPDLSETKFETRALGNIKVAFPNTFARSCSNGCKPTSVLKLRLHSTDNILRYYASGLVKESLTESIETSNGDTVHSDHDSTNVNGKESKDRCLNLFDINESPVKEKETTKIIELDMDALVVQVKQLYDQSPNARYYNVDVLRYQIAPVDQFDKCPIQVCAYWRVEPRLVKLRIDFKHSNRSGFNLDRLREIVFSVDFSNYVPPTLIINAISPEAYSTKRSSRADNINLASFNNLSLGSDSGESLNSNFNESQPQLRSNVQNSNHQYKELVNMNDVPNQDTSFQIPQSLVKQQPSKSNKQSPIQIKLPPPPSRHQSKSSSLTTRASNNLNSLSMSSAENDTLDRRQQNTLLQQAPSTTTVNSDILSTTCTKSQRVRHDSLSSNNSTSSIHTTNATAIFPTNEVPSIAQPIVTQTISTPYITYEPQAQWNQNTKQLTWKFDNLLSYYKTDGFGSLLAKLDFRNCPGLQDFLLEQQQKTSPKPIDIKFMVVDSTLSKIRMSIDSAGYRMSLLKKEVRSGRYTSEPYIF